MLKERYSVHMILSIFFPSLCFPISHKCTTFLLLKMKKGVRSKVGH